MISVWETVLVSIIVLLSLFLGFLVYSKDRKKNVNCYFLFICIFTAFFIGSAYLSEFFPLTSPSLVIFLSKITYSAVIWWAIFLFLFSLTFPKGRKISSKISLTLFILGTFSTILILFTPLLVEKIKIQPWGFDVIYGKLFLPFFGTFFLVLIGLFFFNIIKRYKKAELIEKQRFKYFFLGLGIFCSLIILINTILPFLVGTQQYYYLGNYSAIFFLGFTAYAIISKRLFGIRVVLTELFVGLIGLILLFQAIVTSSTAMKILNSGLFLFYCFFGYLLIRSVLREIQLKEQLEAANKELKKLDEAKTEFLSIASHQLRTPLTAIKGYLAMIQEGLYGDVPNKVRETLNKVNDSSERLIRLVNSLLDISRLEMGRMEFDLKEVQVEDLVQSIVDELYVRASKKKLKLIYKEPEKDLPKITIDPEKIRLVILNLIDNAIKYTDHGEVRVKVEEKNGSRKRILISVSDTGMGIAKKEANQIFKIYRRGTGVRLFPEGSGVGLYVAKKMVEAHKGKIWVKSKGRGEGSTFYVELPINGSRAQKFLKEF